MKPHLEKKSWWPFLRIMFPLLTTWMTFLFRPTSVCPYIIGIVSDVNVCCCQYFSLTSLLWRDWSLTFTPPDIYYIYIIDTKAFSGGSTGEKRNLDFSPDSPGENCNILLFEACLHWLARPIEKQTSGGEKWSSAQLGARRRRQNRTQGGPDWVLNCSSVLGLSSSEEVRTDNL